MVKRYVLLLFGVLLILISNAQNQKEETVESVKYTGRLLDGETQDPLAFAHVAILGTKSGAVTNENGSFTIISSQLRENDTLSFYFVGYRTKKISIGNLLSKSTIYLTSETFSLNEFFVFADNKNPEGIVKLVLLNMAANYKKRMQKIKYLLGTDLYLISIA